MRAPPPELEAKPVHKYKPSDWEPDSDEYDTDLDEESEQFEKEKQSGDPFVTKSSTCHSRLGM